MISLLLTPERASKMLVLAARQAGTLRWLGGPGSGNFGHAGRPGEIGGSGAGGSGTVVYHGTVSSQVEQIKKEGLKRILGGRMFNESRAETVYVTTDHLEAKHWAASAARRLELAHYRQYGHESKFNGVPALLEIRIPEGASSALQPDRNFKGNTKQTNLEFARDVDPSWITKIEVYERDKGWRGAEAVIDGDLVYIGIVLFSGDERSSRVDLMQKLRAAQTRSPETLLHRTADSFAPTLAVAFRYAIERARARLRATKDADLAAAAMRHALEETLPGSLLRAVVAGADTSVSLLPRFRYAEFNPDQERDEQGQWTDGGGSGSNTASAKSSGSSGSTFTQGDDVSRLSNPSTETRPRGTVVAKSKYGTVEVAQSAQIREGTVEQRAKYVGRRKSGESVGTLPTVKAVMDRLREPTNRESYPSGYMSPDVKWKVLAEYTATAGPLQFRFSKTDPQAVKWARKHGAELAKNISETTRQRIKDALAAQIEGKATFDDVIASVGDNERARTIARHESMVATSEGQRQAWDQAVDKGLLSGREKRAWIATGDDKICPICEELDGAVASLDGEYPGEGGEGPPAHVNCRCTEGIVG